MNKSLKGSRSLHLDDPEPAYLTQPLTETERHQLLIDWNQTQRDYPIDCIHQQFEAQVAKTPTAIAICFGDKQLTYRELNERANQLAHYLQKVGVGSEVVIGIGVERSDLAIIGMLGILKAGGAYLPLDPAYPINRLAFMVQDSQIPVLLTQEALIERFSAASPSLICLDADWELISQEGTHNLLTPTTPDQLAYVIYTSGSTGVPKGVLGLHQGTLNRCHWMWEVYPFETHEICCQKTSLSFVDSVWEIFGPLLQGVRLVILPDQVVKDPQALVQGLAKNQITRIVLVPSLLQAIVDTSIDLASQLTQLKYWFTSGEVISVTLAKRFQSRMPQSILINLYGSSEVSADVTYYDTRSQSIMNSVPIGRPIANTQAYILNTDLQPVPIGIVGELYIGGVNLARGYLNHPDLTAERFIPTPQFLQPTPTSQLYRTGDLARYLPNGEIEFLGRLDHQVKIRGIRIELGEIEVVLNQHPSVEEAVVIAQADKSNHKSLTAYVVANSQNQTLAGKEWDVVHTVQWQKVWDEIYHQSEPAPADPTFNPIGWNSRYTGLPFAAEEMHEWVKDAVDQILALQPRRVLEIGCGTGLLLFRIAPQCTQYWATDFSATVLDYVRQHLDHLDSAVSNVTLLQQSANDFASIAAGSFDAVLLNSVIQHFPSIDYLLQVLEKAVRAVVPGGVIFVGDVRSLPLLEAFHTSVVLHQSSATLPIEQVKQHVQKQIAQEEELIVDPAFFAALKVHLPQISEVEIRPKRGYFRNELTRFRYQVILHVGTKPDLTMPGVDWNETFTPAAIRQHLIDTKPETLAIAQIPNARIWKDLKTVELLALPNPPQTVGELRQLLPSEVGIDPEHLWAICDEVPYTIRLHESLSDPGYYNAVFQCRSPLSAAPVKIIQQSNLPVKPWKAYANNPLQTKVAQGLVPQFRSFLHQKLPAYMVPSTFVLLEAFPLTPNGKIDRQALPVPSKTRPDLDTALITPSNPTEEVIAGIWAEVLGLEQVGIHDNFFDLGGHSLLATQVISRIAEAFKVEIPLRHFFIAPTIARLAKTLKSVSREQLELSPIVPVPHRANPPLSLAQEQLWFFNQFEPGNPGFNVPIAVRFTGQLQVETLKQALQEIIQRHEILRTTFTPTPDYPVAFIHPTIDFQLPIIDLQALPASDREREAQRLTKEELRQPFNLVETILFRSCLLRLNPQEHILLWTMHTLICDGWSVRVFIRELTALYRAFCHKQAPLLPSLAIQYADFAAWQRQWLQDDILERHFAYWRQQLSPPLSRLDLPTDRPRQPMQHYRSATQTLALSLSLITSLQLFCRREGVTMFMLLLAMFQTLLHHHTGQTDLLVGAPIANRNRVELEALIGLLGNGIVLRTNLAGNPTIEELLDRVRETVLDAHAHQNLPFGKLMELYQPTSGPPMPPFQVMFNLLNLGDRYLELPGLSAEVLSPPAGLMCEVDLILWVVEQDGGILPSLIYNAELFNASTIDLMLRQFHCLLETIVATSHQHLSDLLQSLTEDG
jgi:amino acid adenylation domain-containing protein